MILISINDLNDLNINSEAINIQTFNSKTIKKEAFDSKNINSEAINSDALNIKIFNSKSIHRQAIEEAINYVVKKSKAFLSTIPSIQTTLKIKLNT